MLTQIETMFDNMKVMMQDIKKAEYEQYMREFRERNGHYFLEMTQYVQEAQDKEAAAKEIGSVLANAVKDRFSVRNKIKSHVQADLNLFAVYYVFPALLLMENEHSELIVQSICDVWGKTFKGSKIRYLDYNTIHDAFNEKILGIF